MNRLSSVRSRLRTGISLAVLTAAIYAVSIPGVQGADPKPEKKTEKAAKPEKKKLAGNELYSIHCSRCHPERYPTEWNSAQWKTLMLHMRVRANLPAAQAKAILKYLQEESPD
jgi:mono/diheme cytochrome c family protein